MKIMIINGPNINMLGIREPLIYGVNTLDDLEQYISKYAKENNVKVTFVQSNHEGILIDSIQEAYLEEYDGIVINPAAYTHTSIALYDAIKATGLRTVEVHISDTSKREAFRQVSYIKEACVKTISGLGFEGYLRAIDIINK